MAGLGNTGIKGFLASAKFTGQKAEGEDGHIHISMQSLAFIIKHLYTKLCSA